MEKKFILFQFSDRTWWKIPAEIVAESRATYFAGVDEGEDYNQVYENEFKYTLEDNAELIDWVKNNMDWKNVKEFAIQERSEDADYDKEFCNCECKIITEGSKL